MRESHGEARSTNKLPSIEYRIWYHMIQRCYNAKNDSFHNYGERGIEVCDEWKHSYVAFVNYVGRRPSEEYSLERIDNNGNYEPGNVKWIPKAKQQRNTRANRLIEYKNQTKSVAEWAEELGLDYHKLFLRLWRGMPVEQAMTKL